MKIADYQITEKIHECRNSIVYRGVKGKTDIRVIIRLLKTGHASVSEITRFKHEYEVIRNIEDERIVKIHDMLEEDNAISLVLENYPSAPLSDRLKENINDIQWFLKIAINLSDIIGIIHKNDIIHKAIKPSCILIGNESEKIKLTDFGIFTELTHENSEIHKEEIIKGNLAYLSPEQTGRMNHPLDSRSDLYSLGITFYEMLTGKIPFQAKDPLEIIHSQMAEIPTVPSLINRNIPGMISKIIMKLLAKTADSRYQSSFGLKADLKECLKQYTENGDIKDFQLAKNDISANLRIPQILIGREQEIKTILSAAERVGNNSKEVLLVSGPPGIGKSAIINEIHRSNASERSFFIQGKYERNRQNVPYSGIILAFKGILRQILSESKEQVDIWGEKIQKAFGANGKIITDVIPDMELVIGKQPEIPDVGPEETQNRFHFVFKNFVALFAKQEHPLLLFLDDLQWVDNASVSLIEFLITSSDIQALLLFGAYRDLEVPENHPLKKLTENLKIAGIPINNIRLPELNVNHIHRLVALTLHCDEENVSDLAELVHKKNNGNPFFVNQFMKTLSDTGLLKIDPRAGWHCDIKEIRKAKLADNVASLLAEKISDLNKDIRDILKICACIGSFFDIETVALIVNQSNTTTLGYFNALMKEGLIETSKDIFQFQHDRIQETAYSLIPESEKKELHYKIGKLMLARTTEENVPDTILYIAHHLNLGIDLIEDKKERYKLAQLNLLAGKRAKASAAFESAYNFFKIGISLLDSKQRSTQNDNPNNNTDCWKTNYTLSLSLYEEATEAAYLNMDFHEMQKSFRIIIENTQSLFDKIKVYEIKIRSFIAQGKPLEAIKTGVNVLKLLGTRFPKNPKKHHILFWYVKSKLAFIGKQIEDIIDLPETDSPDIIARIKILDAIIMACHTAMPDLMPLILIEGFNLSVKSGNCSVSPCFYAGYGFIQCGVGDIDNGYRFGKAALKLIENSKEKKQEGRNLLIINSAIQHNKIHIRETLEPIRMAYQKIMEAGDLLFSDMATISYYSGLFLSGKKLSEFKIEIEQQIEKTSVIASERWKCVLFLHQVCLNLLSDSSTPWIISGQYYDENIMLPNYIQINDMMGLTHTYINKMYIGYLFLEYEQAYEYATAAEKEIESMIGSFSVPVFYFYYSLTSLALLKTAPKGRQKTLLKKIRANQKKIKKWAIHAPMNHLHRYYLVTAELASVSGEDRKAMEMYKKAIIEAGKNQFTQDEAIANELAAKYYFHLDFPDIAGVLIKKAHDCYLKWGALAKVTHLKETYPQWFTPIEKKRMAKYYSSSLIEKMDFSTVLKASQAISGEIVYSRLLSKLMKISIENVGAEKGFLVLEAGDRYLVEAEGEIAKEEIIVSESMDVEAHNGVCAAIVNYVARTKEPLILNDAATEGDFINDPFIIKNKSKSILCVPIANHGKLTGILYLKNDLTIGAFTPERQAVLTVISSQIAISIENARLYENLEQKNTRLTKLDTIKDEFLANTSHELRTPLHGIIGLTQSLITGVGGELSNKATHNLTLIKMSAVKLANLVDDIQDFSRLKNRDIILSKSNVDVKSLTDAVIDLCGPLTDNKMVKLINTIHPDIPLVDADENRLMQIMFNLIGNAVKFTDAGEIVVSAIKIDDLSKNSRGKVEITVADTGIGIEEDKLDHIFESFEQADGSVSREYEGTGIGLAIVKQLVKLHKGSLFLSSTPGKGSRFSFSIPVSTTQDRRVTKAPTSIGISKVKASIGLLKPVNNFPIQSITITTTQKAKILIVDDDPVNLEVMKDYFFQEAYEIVTVTNGAEALSAAAKGRFDIILLDVMMPQISGFEVCRTLRKNFSIYELPIIMLTAKNRIPDLIAGFEAGASDYLAKPITQEELITRVRTHIALKQTAKKHKEAKFKLLQKTMNPHFLFNALNTVHSLIHTDTVLADQAILKLADNYRFLVDKSFKNTISFDEEWEFVKNYLELEELKFSDTLSIQMKRDGNFKNICIPPLTLQPIVENSIKHGLKNKLECGYIEVSAEIIQNMVKISVVDNGTGLQKEDIYSRSLGNILKRLKHNYESAELHAQNRDEGGVIVCLTFFVM